MIIPIDKQHRIASDKRSWNIQTIRRRKKNGKTSEVWESVRYHPSIGAAFNDLADELLRESEATTFLEAHQDMEKIINKFSQALQPRFEIKIKTDEDKDNAKH